MASPEDRMKHRSRRRNRVAKDLNLPKFRQQIKEDKKKKLDLTKMSHSDLVEFINKEVDLDE